MKQQRHSAIRQILDSAPIGSQGELRDQLAARGFRVTQATLSRDIHDLHLVKSAKGYSVPNAGANGDSAPGIREILRTFGMEVRQALNLLVFITNTGSAQPVAAGIDYEAWSEVVGTVAGDDTVLIICPDRKQAAALKTRIEAYLG